MPRPELLGSGGRRGSPAQATTNTGKIFMKAALAASLLLAVPTKAHAQRVFDTHVHIWNGETLVRAYEAQLKATHQTVTRFAGILIAERGKMVETRRKNDELIALATKYPRKRPIDPGH